MSTRFCFNSIAMVSGCTLPWSIRKRWELCTFIQFKYFWIVSLAWIVHIIITWSLSLHCYNLLAQLEMLYSVIISHKQILYTSDKFETDCHASTDKIYLSFISVQRICMKTPKSFIESDHRFDAPNRGF